MNIVRKFSFGAKQKSAFKISHVFTNIHHFAECYLCSNSKLVNSRIIQSVDFTMKFAIVILALVFICTAPLVVLAGGIGIGLGKKR